MTAAHVVDDGQPLPRHPLAPGAAIGVIRENLLDEDRPRFDADVDEASRARDPDLLWECVEHWRSVAMIQSDRAAFTRMVRRAAERNTGHRPPEDEPLELTRIAAGM